MEELDLGYVIDQNMYIIWKDLRDKNPKERKENGAKLGFGGGKAVHGIGG